MDYNKLGEFLANLGQKLNILLRCTAVGIHSNRTLSLDVDRNKFYACK